jgi:Immune inhibitor A-like, MAM domain
LKYFAQLTRDSIPALLEGVVPPPQLHNIGTVNANFTVAWHPFNTGENHPTRWELVELSNPSVKTDSLESGTGRWTLNGFTLSTAQSHSSSHSFFSGNAAGQNTVVTSNHPYLVQANDSITFWCYYNLESNYDVAICEVSENNREWFDVDTARFTGTQTSWQRKAYSLASWVGKSIFIRFRSMYDDGTQNSGFYVDDIRPTCQFGTVTSISQNITDTLYQFSGHATGTYYYYVRGDNAAWDWGEYSTLKQAVVTVGAVEGKNDVPTAAALRVWPMVSARGNYNIEFQLPRPEPIRLTVFDAFGREVYGRSWEARRSGSLPIDLGRLSQGVYFARIQAGATVETVKLIRTK